MDAASPPTATPPRRGLMFVLSSPSGTGKTTLARKLLQEEEQTLKLSISVTTRPPRPGETGGVDYQFVRPEQFDAMAAQGSLLEYATVFGHGYGTPASFVETTLAEGHDVLFDIDWQGTRQLRERCRADLVSVFILPPSMAALEQRLRQRGQDSEAVMQNRMQKATNEIAHWHEYDYVVINHALATCLGQIRAILHAERARRQRQHGLDAFVGQLFSEAADLGYDA